MNLEGARACGMPIDLHPIRIFQILFFIYLIPFFITSIRYADKDSNDCLYLEVRTIEMLMSTWLYVDGIILLLFAAESLIFMIQSSCCLQRFGHYLYWSLSRSIYCAWRLSWLVVGSIIFWRDQWPYRLCPTNVANYTWALLIIGYFHVLVVLMFLIFYRPRPLMILGPAPITAGQMVPTFNMTSFNNGNGTFMNGTTIRMR